MKKDVERIPAHVLDWLEQKELNALSAAQRAEALQYFSEEEYTTLHATRKELRQQNPVAEIENREAIKDGLLQYMKQKKSKAVVFKPATTVWRAAAILLFFVSAGLMVFTTQLYRKVSTAKIITSTDTVYLTHAQQAGTVTVYDTVYITAAPKQKEKADAPQVGEPAVAATDARQLPPAGNMDITIVTPQTIERKSSDTRGTSLGDDSITKRFSFVTL
ncbi:MAG: hypothetical protein EOP56_15565 [Sphingobacteriales bacterium]|nr:MAG: hypothetical protein EOP56_15565 [Sphingobacteriales bacterium]